MTRGPIREVNAIDADDVLGSAFTQPELWVPALIEQCELSAVYSHWSRMWLDMPAFLYRLAHFLSQVIVVDAAPVIESCIIAGGMVMRRWEMDGNSIRIAKLGVRAMLERAFDASSVEVVIDGSPWLPYKHGPITPILAALKDAKVELRKRSPDAIRRSQMELSAAFSRYVYTGVCVRTLRCDFVSLMELT
ncbi:hypothetical protein [Metallibacterium scheffleri]|uniref:hypothetical protein n=1 Tax=Metallibacterium scheffleri TaxID=993689 RepID=UPI0010A04103|nr:hypothetical protein [Metallibacterium scheffleri]